ncbi:hypothetical protein [Ensifer canadensis]
MYRRQLLVAAGALGLSTVLLAPAGFAADAAPDVVAAYVAAWNAHELEQGRILFHR